jgi:DNA-binding GntR family transcriptional regulator
VTEAGSGQVATLASQIGRVAAPLRSQVLEVLREAILSFRFTPGQRLIERELIDMTGVSRTTIREVLRELAAEGLVRTIPQKGAVVVSLTPEEAEELYEIREVLEGHLAKRFVERATDAQVVALRRAFTQLEDVVERQEGTVAVLRAKDVLYEVLLTGAGNSALRATLSQLHARVSLLRARSCASWSRPSRRGTHAPQPTPWWRTSAPPQARASKRCAARPTRSPLPPTDHRRARCQRGGRERCRGDRWSL